MLCSGPKRPSRRRTDRCRPPRARRPRSPSAGRRGRGEVVMDLLAGLLVDKHAAAIRVVEPSAEKEDRHARERERRSRELGGVSRVRAAPGHGVDDQLSEDQCTEADRDSRDPPAPPDDHASTSERCAAKVWCAWRHHSHLTDVHAAGRGSGPTARPLALPRAPYARIGQEPTGWGPFPVRELHRVHTVMADGRASGPARPYIGRSCPIRAPGASLRLQHGVRAAPAMRASLTGSGTGGALVQRFTTPMG